MPRRKAQSVAPFDSFFAGAPVALAFVDKALRIVRVNDCFANLCAVTPSDLVGHALDDALPDLARTVVPLVQLAIDAGSPQEGLHSPNPAPAADRPQCWRVNAFLVRGEGGAVEGVGLAIFDIAKQKAEEEALREPEKAFRDLVESTTDLVWETDELGRYTYVSPKVREMLGYEPEEMLGRTAFDFMPPETSHSVAKVLGHASRHRVPFNCLETTVLRKDGQAVLRETNGRPVFDADGRFRGFRGIDRDITGRKQAEDALRGSEARFHAVFERAGIGMILTDVRGRTLDSNAALREMLGYSADELRNVLIEKLTHPDDVAEGNRLNDDLRQGRCDRYQFEKRYIRKDSRVLWARLTASLVRGSDNAPRFTIGMIEDITSHKEALTALAESEVRFRSIYAQSPIGIELFDADGALVAANEACLAIFGLSDVDEVKGFSLFDDPNVSLEVKEHLRNGEPARYECAFDFELVKKLNLYRTSRSGKIYLDVQITPLSFSAAAFSSGYLVHIQDITARKDVEAAMRESEARFRRLMENAQDLIFRLEGLSSTLRFSYVSPAATSMLGLSPDALYSKPKSAFYRVDARDRPALQTSLVGHSIDPLLTVRWRHPRGELVWIELRLVPICDHFGRVVAVEGIARDVTERKQFEEQLFRAQRLEMAGKVAGQVAHDFNNLLTPLMAYPSLIKEMLPADHPVVSYCDAMLRAADQMAQINDDLLALGRRGRHTRVPTDVGALVRHLIAQLRAACPPDLTVVSEIADALPPVHAAGAQLVRMFSNLISNAREAMGDDGTLTIKAEQVTLASRPTRHPQPTVGQYVRVEISDTGHGIPIEVRDRVFDAFFTTKRTDARRGSGLGLSIVKSVVDDHQGYLDLHTEVGKGTTFSVYLPISLDPVGATEAPVVARGKMERIIVVDDDHTQREVVKHLLGSLGYKAVIASSGEEALDILSTEPADLLLLDLSMPGGIDGVETYRRAALRWPGQRAILLSGMIDDDLVHAERVTGVRSYLRKPVTLSKLARAVRDELDRPLL